MKYISVDVKGYFKGAGCMRIRSIQPVHVLGNDAIIYAATGLPKIFRLPNIIKIIAGVPF